MGWKKVKRGTVVGSLDINKKAITVTYGNHTITPKSLQIIPRVKNSKIFTRDEDGSLTFIADIEKQGSIVLTPQQTERLVEQTRMWRQAKRYHKRLLHRK